MDIDGLIKGIGPESISAGGMAVMILGAVLRNLIRGTRDDARDRQDIKFREDLIVRNRELESRADRFAHERNAAIAGLGRAGERLHAAEQRIRILEAQIKVRKRKSDEGGGE